MFFPETDAEIQEKDTYFVMVHNNASDVSVERI